MTTNSKKDFSIGGALNVHRLGFGAMRITGQGIFGPPADKAEAIRVLKKAVALGINFIDTADSYGPYVSENLIAEALHPYPEGLVIATKGGLLRPGPDQWIPDGSPAHLEEALEGSLQRLKTEAIDLYQLHRIDPKIPAENTFRFLQDQQKKGKIKHIGLSEVTAEQIEQAQQFFNVASVQNMYSIDNRKWESVLDYCKQKNIAFIPWYPLSGGNVESLRVLQDVATEHQATLQQVALGWLLHHADNILPIPGTSKQAHLEDNWRAGALELTDTDMEKLNRIKG